ncbi:MAG: GNAT family N-acetyltransferase [Proteobacteria bacterium]|nr:GNAT family N-acetyltransferase [Pseudomonadota bacterium]
MEKLTDQNLNRYIKNGYRLFFGSGAACPQVLINQFLESVHKFYDLELVHILTLGDACWTDPKYKPYFRVNAFFLGKGSRDAVQSADADYTPCFLSEIPALFNEKLVPIDVAFIQVSPPDQQGYCSLGVSVDVVMAAAKSAKFVVAQINDQMPKTFGNCYIHKDDIDAYIEVSESLIEVPTAKLDQVSLQIGKYASLLIDDGATLQMGIGKIPDAVLYNLGDHQNLGVHTEMFTDGLLELYKNGNINNNCKGIHEGKTITSFCFGTKKLYDFVDNNPHVEFHPTEYVNNPVVIAQNRKMISINSAIEVDLTGQVVSDSVGDRFYSGIGGQVDFIRGAGMSVGGRPIIALPSTAKDGTISRICPVIRSGAGIVTSRGDVHYVVTEYGIATLRGRSIRERVMELIQVAHPKFRDELMDAVKKSYKVPSYQNNTPVVMKDLEGIEFIKLKIENKNYRLRPLQPSDQHRIQQFFYSHSKSSLFQRYRNIPKTMGTAKAYRLVNVDFEKEIALCVYERQGPRETIQGVGRYYLFENGEIAEVAFIVNEELQGKGIGSTLLKRLIKIAKIRGLKGLYADVRVDNVPMRRVFEKQGFVKEKTDDFSVLSYNLDLTQEVSEN